MRHLVLSSFNFTVVLLFQHHVNKSFSHIPKGPILFTCSCWPPGPRVLHPCSRRGPWTRWWPRSSRCRRRRARRAWRAQSSRPCKSYTYDVHSGTEWVGGPQKADKRTKVAWIMYMTRGEGVPKSENFADVICVWSLVRLAVAAVLHAKVALRQTDEVVLVLVGPRPDNAPECTFTGTLGVSLNQV